MMHGQTWATPCPLVALQVQTRMLLGLRLPLVLQSGNLFYSSEPARPSIAQKSGFIKFAGGPSHGTYIVPYHWLGQALDLSA